MRRNRLTDPPSRWPLEALFAAIGMMVILVGGVTGYLIDQQPGATLFIRSAGVAVVLLSVLVAFLAVARPIGRLSRELKSSNTSVARTPVTLGGPVQVRDLSEHINGLIEVANLELAGRKRAEEDYRLLVEVTEREKLKRVRSQSLDGLGHLAGGVAHDFNNLLGVILNFTAFAQEEVVKASGHEGGERWLQVNKDLARVQSAAERGGQLTQKLQAFARREAVTPQTTDVDAVAPSPSIRIGGGETILVVEDQDDLREVTVRMLKQNGYTVVAADGGAEALGLLKDLEGHMDLIITDVVMPHMLGREFAEKATLLRPTARILFISGYAQPVLSTQGRIAPGHTFVEKPFTEPDLLAKVREALQAERLGRRSE